MLDQTLNPGLRSGDPPGSDRHNHTNYLLEKKETMKMEDLIKLMDKLEQMTPYQLYEYANKTYPNTLNAGVGKKKLVIRRIMNLERERMNLGADE